MVNMSILEWTTMSRHLLQGLDGVSLLFLKDDFPWNTLQQESDTPATDAVGAG
jgi:hypothetical protein